MSKAEKRKTELRKLLASVGSVSKPANLSHPAKASASSKPADAKVKLIDSMNDYMEAVSEPFLIEEEDFPALPCTPTASPADESVVKPVVSVYPASRVHVEGSSSLLCLASAMFPPVVQFSWKRQKNNGPLEDLTSEEQLDLRESGRSASILLLHQQEDSSYKYICSVKHEGGTVEAQTQQAAPTSHPASSSILAEGTASVPPLDLVKLSFQSECRVKLLCLLYSVLIVKSLVYCCGLSLLMILRNKGASTNSRHAE
ncbi:uncharacterized protein LOC101157420 [Oryzias latipes]